MTEARLDYTKYDFDSLRVELNQRIKLKEAWKDFYRTGTGQILVELMSYVVDVLMFYLETRAGEAYLDTAKLRSSIIALTRLLNYVPRRKTPAVTELTFTKASGVLSSERIIIQEWTKCVDSGGAIPFLTTKQVAIEKGESSVKAGAIQGERVTIDFTVTNLVNETREYVLDDVDCAEGEIELWTRSGNALLRQWTQVKGFWGSLANSYDYQVVLNPGGKVVIRFGDGIFGRSPLVGEELRLIYIRTLGERGNVVQNIILQVVGDLKNKVTVLNEVPATGGEQAETTREIQYFAPKVFSTGDRAVTREDFIIIMENYPGVAQANAWGEKEEYPPNFEMFNVVRACIVPIVGEGGQVPPSRNIALEAELYKEEEGEYKPKGVIAEKMVITTKLQWVAPEYVRLRIIGGIKFQDLYTLSDAISQLKGALVGEYGIERGRLGASLRWSDFVAFVDNLSVVNYHRLELKAIFDDEGRWVGNGVETNFNGEIPLLGVKEKSVDVYANVVEELGSKEVKVAVDNGEGGFVNVGSGAVIDEANSTIDYGTGEISLAFLEVPVDESKVFVIYQQGNYGDFGLGKNQILYLADEDITVEAIL